jgi:hypothetical protein
MDQIVRKGKNALENIIMRGVIIFNLRLGSIKSKMIKIGES